MRILHSHPSPEHSEQRLELLQALCRGCLTALAAREAGGSRREEPPRPVT